MSKPYYETEEYSEAENELDTYDDPVKLVMEYRISEKHKDKEIADLQHKLEVAERATKLACKEIDSEYMYGVYRSEYPQYFKEQAEKELKGEEDV